MAISTFCCPDASGLVFETRNEDVGSACLLLYGELDIVGAPLLEQECKRIEDRGKQVAVLDLTGLTLIDVAGLHALLWAAAGASKDGRALPMIGADPTVRRVFDLTGYGRLLEV